MLITRTSILSRTTRTRDLPITVAQIAAWQDGMVIQQAMPHLSASDREFIISGITAEEWHQFCREQGDSPDDRANA